MEPSVFSRFGGFVEGEGIVGIFLNKTASIVNPVYTEYKIL